MSDPSPTYSTTGGARIGFVNYSWPMAKLTTTSDRLTITTSFFGLLEMGTYTFTRDQILSMESCGWLPVLGQGVRIHHVVSGYPRKIIFWGDPQRTLTGIAATGFAPAPGVSPKLVERTLAGFPLRWTPLIVLAVILNALFLSMAWSDRPASMDPGLPVLLAVGIFFGVSIAALRFPAVQKVFLKPGREFGEVRNAFLLTAIITGMMTVVFAGMILLSANGAEAKEPATPAPAKATGR